MDIRKNIYSLTDAELTNFVNAVNAAKADGKYDEFIRRHQAAMMDPTTTPPETNVPNVRNVAHRGPAFAPWHRYFIREFELMLQSEVPGVTLPYWDWAADAALADPTQASLWNRTAPPRTYVGGDGSSPNNAVTTGPFVGWTALIASSSGSFVPRPGGILRLLGRDLNGVPTLPRQGQVDAAMMMPDYDTAPWDTSSAGSFRNRLEGWLRLPGDDSGPQLHNRVHTWVGGDMLPGTSPNDPVFFLHHCNVDRLWAQWQHVNSTVPQYLPTSGGPTGHNLNDVMRHLTTTLPSPTPSNAIDYQTNLGYRYDTDPAITFEIHRDHYGQDEIDAARTQVGGPVIKTGFWLTVDGFTASRLGITGPGSTNLAPPIAFNPGTGVSATCTSLDSTDPAFSPDVLQRFRFGYDVNFGPDDSAFNFTGQTETVTLTATFQNMSALAQVTFIKQPDPYILQGPQTWWLSNDIRLVQVAEGDRAFGVPMGNDPFAFLQQLITALETTAVGQTFDVNTSEDNEVLSVAPQTLRGGNLVNVYNFAIARVHYQGQTQPANNVRVFFRLFAANSTATDFHPDTSYSRDPAMYPVPPGNSGQHTTPTPGIIAGEYISIPCFGAARQDPNQAGSPNSLPQLQQDGLNDRNLPTTGGPIRDFYYGCFLDINGTAPMLPPIPPAGNANGPWPPSSNVALEPLRQAFIRNDHQCLVAEIAFDPDPINPGTQPWNSDKLAQRNISWSYAANPGLDLSRGGIETFEVRPTPKGSRDTPDEIMIDWLNVPANQRAEIYLPAVSADAVLSRASQLYPTHRLSRGDSSTIICLTGGVTYIPIPEGSGDGANFAGLIQISLPAGIQRGQLYQVLVRQLTSAYGEAAPRPPQLTVAPQQRAVVNEPALLLWRKVLGTFQINIPVSTKERLLEREELRLSIFRWIAEGIPQSSRWWPVFRRYLELIAIRVSELGGDPSNIKPSPNGYGGLPSKCPEPEDPQKRHEYTGKVEALVFDHFGDFDGFTLELCDGDTRRFCSREDEIEDLARKAWEERIVTTVIVSAEHPHRPLSILLKQSSGWRRRT